MQTWLPYPDFAKSASVLDYRRLGKHRVETKQILEALDRGGGAWYNHPATQMWKGCEPALAFYGVVICEEWISRGYRDSLLPYFKSRLMDRRVVFTSLPGWLGNQQIHSSHRGRLLAKEPSHYQQFHWPDSPRDSVVYLRDIVN